MTARRWLALAALAAGCKDPPPPPPAKTEPWPAPAVSKPAAASRALRYHVGSPSRVQFELPARRGTPRGEIEVVRGHALVDPSDPARSSAELRVDLGAVSVDSDRDGGGIDRELTTRARNWLNLGASLPAAEIERRRWATVTVTGISGSAQAFEARAEITVNDFRVERKVELRARLQYPPGAAKDAAPSQIDLETTKPIEISLIEHAIQPRDALGALIAEDTKLIGDEVGRTAKVMVSLRLVPAP